MPPKALDHPSGKQYVWCVTADDTGSRPAAQPALVLVSADPSVRDLVGAELSKRYGADYLIVSGPDWSTVAVQLEELGRSGRRGPGPDRRERSERDRRAGRGRGDLSAGPAGIRRPLGGARGGRVGVRGHRAGQGGRLGVPAAGPRRRGVPSRGHRAAGRVGQPARDGGRGGSGDRRALVAAFAGTARHVRPQPSADRLPRREQPEGSRAAGLARAGRSRAAGGGAAVPPGAAGAGQSQCVGDRQRLRAAGLG